MQSKYNRIIQLGRSIAMHDLATPAQYLHNAAFIVRYNTCASAGLCFSAAQYVWTHHVCLHSARHRRVDGLSFFEYLSPFCFLSIEFHRTFSIFIKHYHIMFIIIVIWLGCDRPTELLFFVPAFLLSILTPLFLPFRLFILFYSCCSHARVFGKIHVHEFTISYIHTEWYLLFSRSEIVLALAEASPIKI